MPILTPEQADLIRKATLGKMNIITGLADVHAKIMSWEKGVDKDGAEGLFISGWASTMDIDRTGDIVQPEAFRECLAEYMSNPIVTYMHWWDNPIGKCIEADITDMGLYVKIFISSAAGTVIKLIEDGVLRALSIGYQLIEEAVVDGTAHITKLKLMEIAVVSIPANQHCLFSVAKALEKGTDLCCDGCKNHYPDAVIEYEKVISDEEFQALKATWAKAHTGPFTRLHIRKAGGTPESSAAVGRLGPALGEVGQAIEGLTEINSTVREVIDSLKPKD